MAVTIRLLKKDDKCDLFDADDEELNKYLKLYAWQNHRRYRVGISYVAVDEEQPQVVLGYYTLAMSGIPRNAFPEEEVKKLTPYGEIPVVLIGRLAVDKRARGKGLGEALLADALRNIVRLSKSVGCRGIIVDAYPKAVTFYEKYGFAKAGRATGAARPQRMFLDIRTLVKAQKGRRRT